MLWPKIPVLSPRTQLEIVLSSPKLQSLAWPLLFRLTPPTSPSPPHMEVRRSGQANTLF